MDFFINLFTPLPCPSEKRPEVDRLVDELARIGKNDDYLSERPGPPFNFHCRHTRAIDIGKRLNEIGGFNLMEAVYFRMKKKVGKVTGSHLEYCWQGIGKWTG
jgi:hypothetical protein